MAERVAGRRPDLIDPAVHTDEHDSPDRRCSQRPHDGAVASVLSWLDRHNLVLTIAAAGVAPILYLLFVDRYATNSFNGDDWSVVLFVHAAIHGHLSLSQLWGQYNESRLFVGNTIDVLFGLADRLDLRSVIFFSAVLFIASYVIVLALFRTYLGRRLTPVPVLLVGLIWFSLADVQNSLWAFQVSWYLTVLFLAVMLFALLVPESRRTLWVAVAVLAAVAASLSTVQGFLCWPLGAICILWSRPRARQTFVEIASWCGAALLTVALYLPGYDFSNNGCLPASSCSPAVALHHPLTALRFLLALIGAVIPGGVIDFFAPRDIIRFELVGAALLIAAVFILVQSWRHRASTERMPLPLLLIAFALAFDVTITLGRGGSGPSGAASSNRYVMANLILLTALVIYAWAHIPKRLVPAPGSRWHAYAGRLALIALAIFLVVQVREAIGFGLTNGSLGRSVMVGSARLFVNLDRVPADQRSCELDTTLFFHPGALPSFAHKIHDAAQDQLGQFQPSSYHTYRELGLPTLSPACTKSPVTDRPGA